MCGSERSCERVVRISSPDSRAQPHYHNTACLVRNFRVQYLPTSNYLTSLQCTYLTCPALTCPDLT